MVMITAIFSFIAYCLSVTAISTVMMLLMDIAGWDNDWQRRLFVIAISTPYAIMLFEYWMA
jgi:hypothetical protein